MPPLAKLDDPKRQLGAGAIFLNKEDAQISWTLSVALAKEAKATVTPKKPAR